MELLSSKKTLLSWNEKDFSSSWLICFSAQEGIKSHTSVSPITFYKRIYESELKMEHSSLGRNRNKN